MIPETLPVFQTNLLFDYEIFNNELFILTVMIAIGGVAGIASKRLSVTVFGAYLVFVRLAVETQNSTLRTIVYVVLVAVIVMMAFRMWSFGNGSQQQSTGGME